MNLNKPSVKWNCIKMKSDSIYSMRRREKTLKFYQLSMISSNLILISFTTCSKTLFTSMIMVALKKHFSSSHHSTEDQRIKLIFICLVTTLTLKLVYAMMSTRMNGPSRNFPITLLINSFNVQPPLL